MKGPEKHDGPEVHADASARASAGGAKSSVFTTTSWGLVKRAAGDGSTRSPEALDKLCRIYWYPLYAYLRRKWNKSPHDAEDLTQEFFTRLLAREWLKSADPNKGKFRAFLLTSVNNFLFNQYDMEQTLKRGSGQRPVSFEAVTAEKWYGREPATLAAEALYERTWLEAAMERVRERLRQEYAREDTGVARFYPKFEPHVTDAEVAKLYPAWAGELQIPSGTLSVYAHRFRKRFGELLYAEVEQTLDNPTPAEVKEELRHLRAALG